MTYKTPGLVPDQHGWSDTFYDGWTAAMSALYQASAEDKKKAKRFNIAARYLGCLRAEDAWPVRSHAVDRFKSFMRQSLDRANLC